MKYDVHLSVNVNRNPCQEILSYQMSRHVTRFIFQISQFLMKVFKSRVIAKCTINCIYRIQCLKTKTEIKVFMELIVVNSIYFVICFRFGKRSSPPHLRKMSRLLRTRIPIEMIYGVSFEFE